MLAPRPCRRWLIFLALLVATKALASEERHCPDDLDLTFAVFLPPNGAERAINARAQFAPVSISDGGLSITKLLNRSHIWPDSEAFSLIYTLNPDLTGAGPIRRGELLLPKLGAIPGIEKAISEGSWVKVHYDGCLISEILARHDKINALASQTAALPSDRFANADKIRPCVSDGYKDFSAIADALQLMDRPVDHEMLVQVYGDVTVLSDLLQRAVATAATRIATSDIEAICNVAKDLRIKQETFSTVRGSSAATEKWPTVLVVVHTRNSSNQSEVLGLTVHYVQEALQGRLIWEKEAGSLSSPVSTRMPEADYVFWATRGKVVVTEYKKCSVREEGEKPYTCDLVANP